MTEQRFTDEELQQWKDFIASRPTLPGGLIIFPETLKAVFARLEAAENFKEFKRHDFTCSAISKRIGSCDCGYFEAEEAWRQVSGK